jgi:hypothetical protein
MCIMATSKSTPAPKVQPADNPQKNPDLTRIATLAKEIATTAACTADAAQGGQWETNEEHVLICQIQRMGAVADMIRDELGEGKMLPDAKAWILGFAA